MQRGQLSSQSKGQDYDLVVRENSFLREQIDGLKQELADVIAEKCQLIQKFRVDFSFQKDRVNSKVEDLEEALAAK